MQHVPGASDEIGTRCIPSPEGQFATTRWTAVFRARSDDPSEAKGALELLCRNYWQPLYVYLRRSGHSPQDAEDLTQGFFAHVLEKGIIQRASPERGRFRSFLIGSLKHFVSDTVGCERAQKRGGGQVMIALDVSAAEDWLHFEPADRRDPLKLFERRWALSLLQRVHQQLEGSYSSKGKEAVFARLQVYLREGREGGAYAEAAEALGMTEGAVKVEVVRMRKAFRELFRLEIARTVGHAGEIEDEIRHLIDSLRD